jgi:protein-S-isoprenylcysteine O-methyltransferase Ste14
MRKAMVVAYAVLSYALFLAVFLYLIGFVANLGVPRSVDAPAAAPRPGALAVDVALVALFAAQHSVMARGAFKRWWTRLVPAALERSTYVLLSSLILALLFWQWRPVGGVVWQVTSPTGSALLRATSGLGWIVVLVSTFLISHFDLFGLRQAWLAAREVAYRPPDFVTTLLYRVVRHPIMLGFLIAFWATPTMTVGHLLFASAMTAYILFGIQLEERDLMRAHGAQYAEYRRQVSMILPLSRPIPRSAAGHGPPQRESVPRS